MDELFTVWWKQDDKDNGVELSREGVKYLLSCNSGYTGGSIHLNKKDLLDLYNGIKNELGL